MSVLKEMIQDFNFCAWLIFRRDCRDEKGL